MMRVLRQVVPELVCDKDLARRVREMLHRTDDVGNTKRVVVDSTGEMIEIAAIGTLHDMFLFERPVDGDGSTNEVVKFTTPVSWHLETDH